MKHVALPSRTIVYYIIKSKIILKKLRTMTLNTLFNKFKNMDGWMDGEGWAVKKINGV